MSKQKIVAQEVSLNSGTMKFHPYFQSENYKMFLLHDIDCVTQLRPEMFLESHFVQWKNPWNQV